MDQIITESFKDYNIVAAVTAIDVLMALIMSSFYNLILAKFYTLTHGGYSYSRSFVHSIVLVGITIALIMIIIGSNIARAFALVGAMSIVRFRNPIKDSRDLVFIFAAIAVGMACGTQFYLFGLIFILVFSLLLMSFQYFGFGNVGTQNYVIKVRLDKEKRKDLLLVLDSYALEHSIIAVEKLQGEANEEYVIVEFELKKKSTYDAFLIDLEKKVSPVSLNFLVGEGNVSA
jgi:hypothetical protein